MKNNAAKKAGSRKLLWAIIGIAVLLFALWVRSSTATEDTTEQTNETSARPRMRWLAEAKDESAQQDSLDAESVNTGRLRERFLAPSQSAVDTSSLSNQINSIIAQNPDVTFGVSIKDLSTGSYYDYGNVSAMTAASVTKVLTAIDFLKQVELGNRSLNQVMPNGKTAQENMEQMIVVSDNVAWELLNENLTYSQMQEYATSIGLDSYYYMNNVISSNDTAQMFGDLYERKLIGETNTQLLLSYMERANYRDLIIPAVPPGDTTYHKAGEYLINLNDAAIITNGSRTIVLSIYTESTGSYSKSRIAGLMQQITQPTLVTFQLN
jgi:beta-lactamase class A